MMKYLTGVKKLYESFNELIQWIFSVQTANWSYELKKVLGLIMYVMKSKKTLSMRLSYIHSILYDKNIDIERFYHPALTGLNSDIS